MGVAGATLAQDPGDDNWWVLGVLGAAPCQHPGGQGRPDGLCGEGLKKLHVPGSVTGRQWEGDRQGKGWPGFHFALPGTFIRDRSKTSPGHTGGQAWVGSAGSSAPAAVPRWAPPAASPSRPPPAPTERPGGSGGKGEASREAMNPSSGLPQHGAERSALMTTCN